MRVRTPASSSAPLPGGLNRPFVLGFAVGVVLSLAVLSSMPATAPPPPFDAVVDRLDQPPDPGWRT